MILFMGFFGVTKKIYSDDFRKSLRNVSVLSSKEREYLEKVFKNSLKDGLSKFEIEKQCRKLKHKHGDLLEPIEVEKVKKKLLENF